MLWCVGCFYGFIFCIYFSPLGNKCPVHIILFIYFLTCISGLFKVTVILKQNCYVPYFEVRGLWGNYDAAELCLGALVFI